MRSMTRWSSFLPLLPFNAGPAHPAPQDPTDGPDNEGPLTFTGSVAMVVLHATVLDTKGRLVQGLAQADFRVAEAGAQQRICLFRSDDIPVSVGVIVDNSGSMRSKRESVAGAVRAFIQTSNPAEELFVINFDDRPASGLPEMRLFSASLMELDKALSSAFTGGRTALYAAISLGLSQLRKTTHDKKVPIVVGDGGDNASILSLDALKQEVRRSDAMIYTIGLFDDKDRNPQVLKQMTGMTGGNAYLPSQPGDAVAVCERIAKEIRSQYTLGYVPFDITPDNTYRKIDVTAVAPRHGKLLVRIREGYIAVSDRPRAIEVDK